MIKVTTIFLTFILILTYTSTAKAYLYEYHDDNSLGTTSEHIDEIDWGAQGYDDPRGSEYNSEHAILEVTIAWGISGTIVVSGAPSALNIDRIYFGLWDTEPSSGNQSPMYDLYDSRIDGYDYIDDNGTFGISIDESGQGTYLIEAGYDWIDHPTVIDFSYILEGSGDYKEINAHITSMHSTVVVQLATPVPIPSALWLLASAFIGLVGFRRKLRKT